MIGPLPQDVDFQINFASYQGILCSVGEPRWRARNIRGADVKVVASLFRRKQDKGPNHEVGCVVWTKKRRR